MLYPKFKVNYTEKELKTFFSVSKDERIILGKVKKDKNKLGFAIVLKTHKYLGYIPDSKKKIPEAIISWIAGQLELPIQYFIEYKWKSRSFKFHLSIIRKYTKYISYKGISVRCCMNTII